MRKILLTSTGREEGQRAGDRHYRAYVGPPDRYDLIAAVQFGLMAVLGLREYHKLLDIGCGSLRGGRLFIPYLLEGNYYGIEPERWLLEEGIRNEVGESLIELKKPSFSHSADYCFAQFGVRFDFLLAQSIFSHTCLEDIMTCLSNAAAVMHEYSVFAATFVEGDSDYRGIDWVYPEIVSYRPETIRKTIVKAGLICQKTNWHHPSQTWYLIGRPECSDRLRLHRRRIRKIMTGFEQTQPRILSRARRLLTRTGQ